MQTIDRALLLFFFSSRRRHTRFKCDWSSTCALPISAARPVKNSEVVLVIHWAGGRHSEHRVKKNGPGKHRRCPNIETIAIIPQIADLFPDAQIAATLNRLGRQTGDGNSWKEGGDRSVRS